MLEPPQYRPNRIDLGKEINGHFYLDVEGQTGDRIDIAWGQTLIGGRVRPVVTWGGGGTALGSLADQLILRGGRQRWESLHWESFRYVQLIFRDLSKPLKLHRFAAIKRDPPLTTRGHFACSDEVLTWAWRATERTVRATTQDAFMDNTFREKDIWGGECGSNAILTTLACYGDELLTRHGNRRAKGTHPPER